MRETATLRLQMEQINTRYPAQELLRIRDVAEYTGLSINTAKKHFPFIRRSPENPLGGCTKIRLAVALDREGMR